MEITITVPLHQCMKKDAETGGRKGHMHMQMYPRDLKIGEELVGTVGVDMSSTNLVMSIGGEHYHIPTVEIWKAVKEATTHGHEELEEDAG